MRRSNSQVRRFVLTLLVPALLALAATRAAGQGGQPGTPPPATSEINDQKTGSVLIFNLYTSSAVNPALENTKLSVTNTNLVSVARLRVFFVDGVNGVLASFAFLCLTPSQTVTFLASDIDPGSRGFIVMIAVDAAGCPVNFNFLAGSADVKLASGFAAAFHAEAVAAIAATPAGCTTTATLNFNGSGYNRLPRALALDKVRNRAVDANATLLVVNRMGGNYNTVGGGATLGTLNGEVVDPVGQGFGFATVSGNKQLFSELTDAFPVTAPVFSQLIPGGSIGWLSVSSATDAGILGVMINRNPNSAFTPNAFNGGHNLRKLTLATNTAVVIPIFTPTC